MRVVHIQLWMATITFGLFGLSSCNQQTETVAKVYLIDQTSEEIHIPDVEQIKSGYGFQDNLFKGGYYRLCTLSDIAYTTKYEAEIQPTQELMEVKDQRIKLVNQFYRDIEHSIGALAQDTGGRTHSTIFDVVVQELHHLSEKTEATTKQLVIYSDLREHNDKLSLYDAATKEQLKMEPSAIRSKLLEDQAIPNLKGITVFINLPITDNHDDNQVMEGMSRIYYYILSQNGATVHISTVNSNIKN